MASKRKTKTTGRRKSASTAQTPLPRHRASADEDRRKFESLKSRIQAAERAIQAGRTIPVEELPSYQLYRKLKMAKQTGRTLETREPDWSREAKYLMSLDVQPERVSDWGEYPFNLPFVKGFHLAFTAPLTFFVGENGSGKSTIIEAIADKCRLPVEGGGPSELDTRPDSDRPRSQFARALEAGFCNHVHDGFFVRAENLVRFADLLEQREGDPDFYGDPYRAYGGRSMHQQSHGEAFLSLFQHRLQSGGVIVMDEPESALSAQRQLTLLAILYQFVQAGNTQVFIASHSPILMTFPGASLLEVSENGINPIRLEDTTHYQITRSILENPERYWKHLRGDAEE